MIYIIGREVVVILTEPFLDVEGDGLGEALGLGVPDWSPLAVHEFLIAVPALIPKCPAVFILELYEPTLRNGATPPTAGW